MEDAGTPTNKCLGIAKHLIEMLPNIPVHLAFHSTVPMVMGFMPEMYTSRPWLKSNLMDIMQTPPLHKDCKALDVLCEEIIKNIGDALQVRNVHPPMACLSVPLLDSFSV